MLAEEISILASQGKSCFSFSELSQRVPSSAEALKSALRRLQKKGGLAMPHRGFYVIVSPEYRSLGCLPAEQFIPDLMSHLGEPYYAGLLSAAVYHGAAHQRPQVFQVMVAKPRRPIKCGKVQVDFVVKKNAQFVPTQPRNTSTGVIQLSTPEATAFDLVGYSKKCGGLDNVVTVLAELAEKLEPPKLVEMAETSPISWAQRLGYLLSIVGAEPVGDALAQYVQRRNPVRTPLLPSAEIKGAKTDSCWKVFVNTKVEPDDI